MEACLYLLLVLLFIFFFLTLSLSLYLSISLSIYLPLSLPSSPNSPFSSMMLSEYSLLLQSSAVVLMIGGVLKELLTIFLGVLVFSEIVRAQAWVGFGIVTLGVLVFKFDKTRKASTALGVGSVDKAVNNGRGQRIHGTTDEEDEDMVELMGWTSTGLDDVLEEDEDAESPKSS